MAVRTGRERFRTEILARGHSLVADEPKAVGGGSLGPEGARVLGERAAIEELRRVLEVPLAGALTRPLIAAAGMAVALLLLQQGHVLFQVLFGAVSYLALLAPIGRIRRDDLLGKRLHQLDLKLGWSNERSDETYPGLSDADFAVTPQRRYAATQRDRMDWDHLRLQLAHRFELGDALFHLATLPHEGAAA